mmetsp:Transcript_43719/g.81563  ORF Transcript_43719/g.81563 Transcript_43719/m.81563 type:complete len:203 (+) Transcript_43719:240-848(+)
MLILKAARVDFIFMLLYSTLMSTPLAALCFECIACIIAIFLEPTCMYWSWWLRSARHSCRSLSSPRETASPLWTSAELPKVLVAASMITCASLRLPLPAAALAFSKASFVTWRFQCRWTCSCASTASAWSRRSSIKAFDWLSLRVLSTEKPRTSRPPMARRLSLVSAGRFKDTRMSRRSSAKRSPTSTTTRLSASGTTGKVV